MTIEVLPDENLKLSMEPLWYVGHILDLDASNVQTRRKIHQRNRAKKNYNAKSFRGPERTSARSLGPNAVSMGSKTDFSFQ